MEPVAFQSQPLPSSRGGVASWPRVETKMPKSGDFEETYQKTGDFHHAFSFTTTRFLLARGFFYHLFLESFETTSPAMFPIEDAPQRSTKNPNVCGKNGNEVEQSMMLVVPFLMPQRLAMLILTNVFFSSQQRAVPVGTL